jgi:hypothetical protein
MAEHIDFERLVAWWLGEADDQELEEHCFACAQCAGRQEWLAALADGVRAAVRDGRIAMVASARFVEAMKRARLRLREYRLGPGETVSCTIASDDDAVVSRVRAPVANARRVDALWRIELAGMPDHDVRLEDVPFDATSGEVLFMPGAAALRKMPAHTQRLRLVAVDEKGERLLGEYAFAHTPSP